MKKRIANWGNYPVVNACEQSFVFSDQLRELILREQHFIPRGNGRCYGDASLADTVISTLKFDKILSFDKSEGVFECQSGLLLDQVLEVIVPAGWFLPVTPGTKFITVGGAVASDIHGKNHRIDGSFSNHIEELEIMLASGESVICSPRINYDLFESTCGGMGLTGMISRAKFKLKKIASSFILKKQIKADSLEDLIGLIDKHREYTYSAAWIDCLKKGPHFGRGILMLGEHAGINDLDEKRKTKPLQLPRKRNISLPFYLPFPILNTYLIKTFNFLYFTKQYKKEMNEVISYEPFFFPLDTVLHWNRGYGKAGFIQYQFVVPLNRKQGLFEVLNRIRDKGMAPFLAVLKVFGDQESIISFPREGYTLSLDFTVKAGLFELLNEIDQVVMRNGGRLYLSKDARMGPEILRSGYPELNNFIELVRKYNPGGKIHSMLSDRLYLTTN
jgi:decaprenylphospho-beta-D-ribofuranose 2-oxidase